MIRQPAPQSMVLAWPEKSEVEFELAGKWRSWGYPFKMGGIPLVRAI